MIGIIPARAGSTRLPGKNVSTLGGKSLVALAIEGALKSGVFSKLIVSSDDPQVITMAREYPVDIDERPTELSGGDVRVVEVVKYLLSKQEYADHNTLAVLFVTSPFREAAHIQEAARLLEQGRDSVLSITKMAQPPQFALKKEGENVVPWVSYDYFRINTQKQKMEPLYYPNFAIQMCKKEVVFTYNGFLGDDCGYVEISPEKAVDIDTQLDFDWARFLLKEGILSLP
ncbi:MAG: acylneuraminate cytidylyltransferase family protein [Desulfobulbaceae bacterium]|nr:acylneuraminate cytidylyltransferase family protein [Desulfobulbaceae bacterium]MCK5543802.1 acylneuraminate cytidylyltransferase family protein [Desulfobulbaceae bacterium]